MRQLLFSLTVILKQEKEIHLKECITAVFFCYNAILFYDTARAMYFQPCGGHEPVGAEDADCRPSILL